ncbi:MAG: DNA polymerase III subunit chi [Burkholderiales bacterium]|nr:DNA polymerase III subunit chi [Burkholderiales bacterium]
MTTVDFYINVADRERTACRLAGKAAAQGRRMHVLVPDPAAAERLDRLLWAWPATAFVPHCMDGDPLAPETPVLIGLQPQAAPEGAVLLNLCPACPPGFERYARILEVVTTDEEDRRLARARYARYREQGCAIRTHDLGAKSGA